MSHQLGGFSIAALNAETVTVTGHPECGDLSTDRECGDSETDHRRGKSDRRRRRRLQSAVADRTAHRRHRLPHCFTQCLLLV